MTVYDILQDWLQTQTFDILILQEIHHGLGKDSNQWHSRGWNVITSVDPSSRFQGIAVFIRSSVAPSAELKHCELIQGRLLHVRMAVTQSTTVDLLAVYQHAWHPDSGSAILDKRMTLWTQLSSYTQGLPARNQLLVAGDFNCSLCSAHACAGGATGPGLLRPQTLQADSQHFVDYVSINGLCALNTWMPLKKYRMATYNSEHAATQIDFILTRKPSADRMARRSLPMPHVNLAPWRGGSRHFMVSATLPVYPGWRTGRKGQAACMEPRYDKAGLDEAARRHLPQMEQLQWRVSQQLCRVHEPSAAVLNDVLLKACSEVFPPSARSAERKAWQAEPVQCSLKEATSQHASCQG